MQLEAMPPSGGGDGGGTAFGMGVITAPQEEDAALEAKAGAPAAAQAVVIKSGSGASFDRRFGAPCCTGSRLLAACAPGAALACGALATLKALALWPWAAGC